MAKNHFGQICRGANYQRCLIGRHNQFSILFSLLFGCSFVAGSYFIDIPEQQLFTPPDGYVFAVNLNQLVTFDVTVKDDREQTDVDIIFHESVEMIVPDPACESIPILNRSWCPLGNTTMCSCLVRLLSVLNCPTIRPAN